MANFYATYPFEGGGGGSSITSINGATGPAITIAAGTGISIGTLGNTVTVTNTVVDTGVTTVGAIDTNANSNGLFISGTTISTQSASVTNPGMVNNTTQSMSGAKTFTGNLAASASSTTSFKVGTSTLIVDTTNNLVGINVQPAAAAVLDVLADTSAATQVEQLTGYGANNIGIRVRHARGTSGAPTQLLSGDPLGFFGTRGYGASQFAVANTGSLQFVAAENFTNTANGTYFIVNATPIGSVTLAEAMRVASTGVTLGPQSSSTAKHQVNGGIGYTTRTVTGNLTVDTTTTDYIIFADSSGGAFNITLPTPVAGRVIVVKDSTGSFETNNVTLVRSGTEQIEGLAASRPLMTAWSSWTITTNGTNWFFI